MSLPDAADIVADPTWLAHRYDETRDAFRYRKVSRARHAEVPFATDDCLGVDDETKVVSREEAARLLPATAPIHFIFHSGFCASTMLVRALDVEGSAMGLSEPVVLNDMVGWLTRGAEPRKHGRVLDDALGQLARPFGPGEAVVIKPSNVFNRLAAGTMTLRPEAKAILLYSPLPEYLLSVARKGMWCRLWARELLERMLQQGMVDLGFEPKDYFRQSDLQVAAVGWVAQQMWFARLSERLGGQRIATLDSERLTREPAATVSKVASFLGLPRANAGEAAYAAHPAIARDSKSGSAFVPGQRQRDQDRAREAYGEEIDQVVTWAIAVAKSAGVSLTLPNSFD